MKNQPLVSIILPTYNGEKYLKEAIESVLNQGFGDFELILINDGSTDKTPGILDEYRTRDSRIKVIHQENIGLVKSLNKGIKLAEGKYIARIDDDDLWHDSKKLEKQVGFLEKHPDHVLVGGGVIAIDKDGRELFRYYKPRTDHEIRKTILFKCPFAHSAVFFKKKETERTRLYREDIHFTEDWEFWMRLGKVGKFYNFPEYLIKHRVYGENVGVQGGMSQLKEGIKIIEIHREDYPDYFRALIYNYAKLFFFSLPFSQILFRKFLSIKRG